MTALIMLIVRYLPPGGVQQVLLCIHDKAVHQFSCYPTDHMGFSVL